MLEISVSLLLVKLKMDEEGTVPCLGNLQSDFRLSPHAERKTSITIYVGGRIPMIPCPLKEGKHA